MHSFIELLRKEIIDFMQVKNLVLLAVFVFFAAGTPIMLNLMPMIVMSSGAYGKDVVNILPKMSLSNIVSSYSGGLSQLGMLAITFIFGGVIAEERAKGTTALIIVKSVSRVSYLAAKIIAAVLLCLILSFLSFLVLAYTTWVFMPDFSVVNLINSVLLLFAFNVFVVVMSVEFSAMFKKPIAAGVCAMSITVLLGVLPMVLPEKEGTFIPSRLYKFAVGAADGVFVWNDIWPALAGAAVMLAVLFTVSERLFSKAEL
jgi:ABC-2 type transport system permease protein